VAVFNTSYEDILDVQITIKKETFNWLICHLKCSEEMGSSEKFCLRWNDFESNISLAFREIREEKDFFDCTLSCGSKQLQAHKLILSACSPFFRSILRQNPHQHPLLYLKGVDFTDMQAVLNFMYHGEVNVAQDELNSFLAVAEDLKVKGLTQSNNSSDGNPSSSKPKSEPFNSVSRPRPQRQEESSSVPKRTHLAPPPLPAQRYQEDDDVQEVMPIVKQEPLPVLPEPNPPPQPLVTQQSQDMYQPTHTSAYQENTVAQLEESYGDDGYDYGGYEGDEYAGGAGIDNHGKGYEGQFGDGGSIELHVVPVGSKFSCGLCGKEFNHRNTTRRHIRFVHEASSSSSVTCHLCSSTLKNEQSLKAHLRTSHTVFTPRQ